MRHGVARLDEAESPSPVLSYAPPTKHSGYAIASLVVSALCVLWMAAGVTLPLPVDNYKHHRIGTIAAILALILAFGAHRAVNRKRSSVRAAWWAGALALLVYVALQPL